MGPEAVLLGAQNAVATGTGTMGIGPMITGTWAKITAWIGGTLSTFWAWVDKPIMMLGGVTVGHFVTAAGVAFLGYYVIKSIANRPMQSSGSYISRAGQPIFI